MMARLRPELEAGGLLVAVFAVLVAAGELPVQAAGLMLVIVAVLAAAVWLGTVIHHHRGGPNGQ
jgi:hypothetical protein